jgi:hypothetical protein
MLTKLQDYWRWLGHKLTPEEEEWLWQDTKREFWLRVKVVGVLLLLTWLIHSCPDAAWL